MKRLSTEDETWWINQMAWVLRVYKTNKAHSLYLWLWLSWTTLLITVTRLPLFLLLIVRGYFFLFHFWKMWGRLPFSKNIEVIFYFPKIKVVFHLKKNEVTFHFQKKSGCLPFSKIWRLSSIFLLFELW
jgi:hypothetical protein